MSGGNTFVFAKITPKPGHLELVKNGLMEILEPTRNEEGCLQFELHVSECGGLICIYEEWTSKVALGNHHQEVHTKKAAQKIGEALAAPTEVTVMKKV